MAVLSILPLLALLVVGSGSVTRSSVEAVACENNHRQLIRAWGEHAQDNRFVLWHSFGDRRPQDWGFGNISWDAAPDNTNVAWVLTPAFRPYIGSDTSVFRCPSDRYVSVAQQRRGWRSRVRTYSMNAHVGATRTVWGEGYPVYAQMDDFTNPSATFVFMEEHPGSINDASFATDPAGARIPARARFIDIPASFHGRAAHFGFADGHVELHRWVGPRVVQPVEGGVYVRLVVPAPNDPDAIWLGLNASQRR